MENPTILVIDGDPKNLHILRESFESSRFKVLTTNNGYDAWNVIKTQKPEIILSEVDIPGLNGFQLLRKLQEDPLAASIPLIFLTNRRDLEDRIKSLRSGVKDYMIKPLHVKEVIARVQMILRRINTIKNEEVVSCKKIVGRLEENSVEELIEKFGVERKTGVLTLYDTNNRSGEIYFKDGAVVNATLGNFKAEKAVYQMFLWQKGHFIMTFKEINVEDDISISNLGLLLHGFKRMQEREKLLGQLPQLDSVLVKTPIFKQILKRRSITTEAFKFISLFDGKRTISDIITESTYEDLKALEKIVKLYQQGFIKPLETPKQVPKIPEERPTPLQNTFESHAKEDVISEISIEKEELTSISDGNDVSSKGQKASGVEEKGSESDYIEFPINKKEKAVPKIQLASTEDRPVPVDSFHNGKVGQIASTSTFSQHTELLTVCDKLFENSALKTGHLALIIPEPGVRKELISNLTGGSYSLKTIDSAMNQTLELVKISTVNGHTLEILGLSTENRFLQMLIHLKDSLVGYIVAVPGNESFKMGYLGYLINFLKNNLNVPHIIAVYHDTESTGISLDFIRNALRIDEKEQLVEFDVRKIDSVIHLISQLIPPDNSRTKPTDFKKMVQELVQTEK